MRHSHVLNQFDKKNINVIHVPTEQMRAIFHTKPLRPKDFNSAVKSLLCLKQTVKHYDKVAWIQKTEFRKGRKQIEDDNDCVEDEEKYCASDGDCVNTI